ncbi:hypothetical protein Patl1_34070 [Pistacia atlantica]|uniref:Uncharacterized protein n=1 Tax=Pistacia atlantica TaxID=434234 RepID=A0ACC0ZT18_9ROSI|nr:hypothetical protein Patl1_34070 [Pistacia atlantica]
MVTTVPALIAIRTSVIHPDPEKCGMLSHVAATGKSSHEWRSHPHDLEDVKNGMLFLIVKYLKAVVLQTVEFLFNHPPGRLHEEGLCQQDGSSRKLSVHIGFMLDVGKKPQHLLTCLCQGQLVSISRFSKKQRT